MPGPTVIIIDAGVIAGLVRPRDQWHAWSMEQMKQLRPPLYTCEAVISEAAFLLRDLPVAQDRIMGMLCDGFLSIDFSLSSEILSVRSLMTKYADIPMSVADACLVRMSELMENSAVLTVDSDFLIYRKHSRRKIPLISPF